MSRYPEMNEQTTTNVVHDAQAHYGTHTAVTLVPQKTDLLLNQFIIVPMHIFENASTASVNTGKVLAPYYNLLKDAEAKLAELQHEEQERWEQLEMKMGVEKDIKFKEPNRPKRRITAIVHNRGHAPVPPFFYDPVEE